MWKVIVSVSDHSQHRLGTVSNKLLSGGGGGVLNRFYARATLAHGSDLLLYRYKKTITQ